VVILDFRFEHLDDDLAIDRLTFVDGQPVAVFGKIRELKFGNVKTP